RRVPTNENGFYRKPGPPRAWRIPTSCRFTSSRHTVTSCSSSWASSTARRCATGWSGPARSRRGWRRSCCRKWRGRSAPRTGRAPFEAANVPAILTKHVYEPAPLVQALRAEVPAKLGAVVDRLLRKAPPERFQTADDLARVAGELRGRDFRAPPLLRAFVRN